jgi:hypothetical protein
MKIQATGAKAFGASPAAKDVMLINSCLTKGSHIGENIYNILI